MLLGIACAFFPGGADAVAEAWSRVRLLGAGIVARSVPSHGGRVHEYRGFFIETLDKVDHLARDAQTRRENLPALPARPQSIGDGLAREIDDGIDARVGSDLTEIGYQPAGCGEDSCASLVAREHGHVMAAFRE